MSPLSSSYSPAAPFYSSASTSFEEQRPLLSVEQQHARTVSDPPPVVATGVFNGSNTVETTLRRRSAAYSGQTGRADADTASPVRGSEDSASLNIRGDHISVADIARLSLLLGRGPLKMGALTLDQLRNLESVCATGNGFEVRNALNRVLPSLPRRTSWLRPASTIEPEALRVALQELAPEVRKLFAAGTIDSAEMSSYSDDSSINNA